MRLNTPLRNEKVTHEGGPAFGHLTPIGQLRRSVLSCLLWEREFYEDGVAIADRISETAKEVDALNISALAYEARTEFNLRHVPLLLLCALAEKRAALPRLVSTAVDATIQRADELTELLAVYWRNGRKPLPAGFKKGLAKAFQKFDAYQLGKYNRDGAIKLRDVLFITHAKPKDEEQAAIWKRLVDGTLESPDTWEVSLSAKLDKKETFERLIKEGNLGYFALLRNLRNMVQAGVDELLIKRAILARRNGAHRVLPFRYIAAARAVPQLEPELDLALDVAIAELPVLPGKTVVLVDVSGSMNHGLSGKSDLKRMDAAAALASIIPGDLRVFTFSNGLVEVPPRRGMAGVDAIIRSQPHGSTMLRAALEKINAKVKYDRIIVVTDEQSHDGICDPVATGYLINVASAKNGVGYGRWNHIDGFSESVLRYIAAAEATDGEKPSAA
jgi:hypothetical protein